MLNDPEINNALAKIVTVSASGNFFYVHIPIC